jgi:hypothetical protein
MSITTYAELQTAVGNWLNRSDLTSYIPDFIKLAESNIESDIMGFEPPPRFLETTASGTTSGNTLAIPSDYASMISFIVTIGGQSTSLQYISPTQAANFTNTSYPRYYTPIGDNFQFSPPLDGSYAYTLNYYKGLTALSSGVNWILTNAPDIYLYASLLQADIFLKNDPRLSTWMPLYQNSLDNLREATIRDRKSGSTLRMRAEVSA